MNKTINVSGLSEEQVKFIQDLVEFLRAKAAKKRKKPKKAVEIEFGVWPLGVRGQISREPIYYYL